MRLSSARTWLILLGVGLAAWGRVPQPEPNVQDKIKRLQAEVTKLRGLDFPRPVKADSITKEQFRELLRREFDRDLPVDKAGLYARGYAKFGLVPQGFDLREGLVDLLTDATAAYYDPRTKDLNILRSAEGTIPPEIDALRKLGIDIEGSILVHELTHAAEDQAFTLSTLPLDSGDNDDLSLALKALIEGDASAVGWKYAFGQAFDSTIGIIDQTYKTGELPGKADTLPAYLRLTLTFPYGYGTDFVLACIKEKGGAFRSISELFGDMPLSSEQILHPEKYFGTRDYPIRIVLPDVPAILGPGWKESFQNVFGEYSVFILLSEFLSPKLTGADAHRASEGWGGDRYSVVENGEGRTAYLWFTTWDTEMDAAEFHQAYTLALQKKYGLPLAGTGGKGVVTLRTSEESVLLEIRGHDVLIVDGLADDVTGKAEALWKGMTKSVMRSFDRVRPEGGPAPSRSPSSEKKEPSAERRN